MTYEVTKVEYNKMKSILETIPKTKAFVKDFEKHELPENLQTIPAYVEMSRLLELVERAIELILDEDIKRLLTHRYLKGQSYAQTMLFFSGLAYTERTLLRKITEGINDIARSFKMWGELA